MDLAERLRGLQATLESAIERTARTAALDATLLDLAVDDARGLLAVLPFEQRSSAPQDAPTDLESLHRLLRGVLLAVDHAEHESPSLGVETLRRAMDAVRRRAEAAGSEFVGGRPAA